MPYSLKANDFMSSQFPVVTFTFLFSPLDITTTTETAGSAPWRSGEIDMGLECGEEGPGQSINQSINQSVQSVSQLTCRSSPVHPDLGSALFRLNW